MRAALLLLLVAGAGCGGAVCGNGDIEEGEQCDDGNTADGDACSASCRALATVDTFIHFTPFITQYQGFSETCSGLGIETVEIALTGPRTMTESVECALVQLKLSSLPSGTYTATATGKDSSGAAVTRGMTKKTFTVGTQTQDVQLEWAFEDFIRSYTGTFLFELYWGGQKTCAAASPPVTRQRLLLERNGVPVAATADNGQKLDGTVAAPCRDANALAQFATGVVWGPARLTVKGEDDAANVLYQKTFETFVGAGVVNPTLRFDSTSLAPDAGPPDAAAADSGL